MSQSSLIEELAQLAPYMLLTDEQLRIIDDIPTDAVAEFAYQGLDDIGKDAAKEIKGRLDWVADLTGADISRYSAPVSEEAGPSGNTHTESEGIRTATGREGRDPAVQDPDQEKLSRLQGNLIGTVYKSAPARRGVGWLTSLLHIGLRDTAVVTLTYTLREYIALATQKGIENKSSEFKEDIVSGLMGALLALTVGTAIFQRVKKTSTMSSEAGWAVYSAALLAAYGVARKTETLADIVPIVTKGVVAPILRDGAYAFLPKATTFATREKIDPQEVNQTFAATAMCAVIYGLNQYPTQVLADLGLSGSGSGILDVNSSLDQFLEMLKFAAGVAYGETVEQLSYPMVTAASTKTKRPGRPQPAGTADMPTDGVWRRASQNIADLQVRVKFKRPSLADLGDVFQTGFLPRQLFFICQFLLAGYIGKISGLDRFSESQRNNFQMLAFVAANMALYFPYVLSTKLRSPPVAQAAAEEIV
ncbi:MAG: hypothetical protein ACRC44_06660 [Bifidobacterium asteroides]